MPTLSGWATRDNPAELPRGSLLVSARSAATIDAYTLAGAVSVAKAPGQRRRRGRRSLGVGQPDRLRHPGRGQGQHRAPRAGQRDDLSRRRFDHPERRGRNRGLGRAEQQRQRRRRAFGAAFSVNQIGGAGEGSSVLAEVDDSEITADGDIQIDAVSASKSSPSPWARRAA